MEATASYLLVLQIYQFKAKDNISKYFAVDNIKKTKLKGIVFFFSVAFNHINITYILDMHKHLKCI